MTSDMTEDRAQVLACFLYPPPATPGDLVGRCVNMADSAAAILGLPDGVSAALRKSDRDESGAALAADAARLLGSTEALDLGLLHARLEDEADKMVAERLLSRPCPPPDNDDGWKPPPGVYELTRRGSTQAWAVWQAQMEHMEGNQG